MRESQDGEKRISTSSRIGGTNDNNNNSFSCVLSLSFEELPSYLKYSFLYFAHFPEDYEINDDVQVVSMTGMGGLGKTTLTRQAFNHDKVKASLIDLYGCVFYKFVIR